MWIATIIVSDCFSLYGVSERERERDSPAEATYSYSRLYVSRRRIVRCTHDVLEKNLGEKARSVGFYPTLFF